ncbi:MAG: hypothetical protein KGH88_04435 [Thaumarchaeota archaeon]|nr:hypothetical protein [Nitrososphaerota archaeon]
MALKAAIIMSIISIIMLAVYGADVAVAGPESSSQGNTGFLPMDDKIRGSVFGIIPSAMLIASFFITRKEASSMLGALIIIGGALIVVGTGVILSMSGNQFQAPQTIRDFGPVLGIGIIIVFLGGLKIKRSKRQT